MKIKHHGDEWEWETDLSGLSYNEQHDQWDGWVYVTSPEWELAIPVALFKAVGDALQATRREARERVLRSLYEERRRILHLERDMKVIDLLADIDSEIERWVLADIDSEIERWVLDEEAELARSPSLLCRLDAVAESPEDDEP